MVALLAALALGTVFAYLVRKKIEDKIFQKWLYAI